MSDNLILLENFLQALAAGLMVGCLYGLMCTGLGMIFGIMRVINFAQGDLMMLGMYAAWYLFTGFGVLAFLGPYAGPVIAAMLAGPILYVVGYFMHQFLVSRVTGVSVASSDNQGHYAQLILTLGIALILQNGGLILFGSEPNSIRTPMSSSAWEVGPLVGEWVSVFLNKARLVGAVVSILVALGLYAFVTRTRLGKALRASADNVVAAQYMGINVDRAHRIAFGIGTAITAVAGGLVAMYYPFQPYVGIEFVIVMYAGVVLGGLGSITGAFWGGMTIGLVQQLSTLILPIQLQNTAIFVVFLLVIFFRPQGLFGNSVERV
ncbi:MULTISPECIES: branched-chain amino acid ABC transporter permease [unclassified Mesorhizobium]|uniref:branched-chain amino acid ABC transporter permease n=1 Tax=unclassified Mesorhizobium TaxID=325217 RepID=UPI0006F9CE8B|nr:MULTISPECIES: branched-chain amino acid ABC transporter permease [unclassified Mesorhizobium]KQZ13367.1 branched-chain amino acid ABC transporter permease [Mesorhizobium sp. Root1471]KQZ35880.1 branched-chain amino acid ABC transporter permease [Mesorhizobium sp. Root554]MDR7032207.1 branched-chain amino acid transport system permease protein [Mesorhizobium sp. BE184]